MLDIRPIETIYRGYRFRSRLEARWAVFFQTLGVQWEYEPEGFELSNGTYYLPDFRVRLRDCILWCEVKPREGNIDLFVLFMKNFIDESNVIGTILHEIPDSADFIYDKNDDFHIYPMWDNYYQFCICQNCKAIGFKFQGRSARIRCGCDKHGSDRDHTYDNFLILKAYTAARSARFEYGEQVR